MPERAENLLDISGVMVVRYSELQEFYFSLFLLIYLYSIKNRLVN